MSRGKKGPSEVAEIVARNLRAIRGELVQARFAKIIGVENQATYQRYEKGRLPKPAILQSAAKRLGISVPELLSPLPHERTAELQKRAMMMGQMGGDAVSGPARDDFGKPDLFRVLWRVTDAALEKALKYFLTQSVRRSGLERDICLQVSNTIRQEQDRRGAVAANRAWAQDRSGEFESQSPKPIPPSPDESDP